MNLYSLHTLHIRDAPLENNQLTNRRIQLTYSNYLSSSVALVRDSLVNVLRIQEIYANVVVGVKFYPHTHKILDILRTLCCLVRFINKVA